MAIRAIGIELEGGWSRKPAGYRSDGSVCDLSSHWSGETASPGKGMPLDEWEEWVRGFYPEQRNSSCGIHVHLSFTTKAEYSYLMNQCGALENRLISNLREWGSENSIQSGHPFWDRIEGHNTFCRKGSDPDEQASSSHKTRARYRILNFCYRLHGTLEIRVLPTFRSVDLAVSAIRLVYQTIEDFLAQKSLFDNAPLKRRVIQTNLGPLHVKPWKQGVTCSLIAGPEVKKRAKEFLYSWPQRFEVESLGYRLLSRTNVQCPMSTDAGLSRIIEDAVRVFNQAQVTIQVGPVI